jgi:nitroimidazol reductase NimA-like FMN-containing flavoprotein (pyridoxamine 5'-phosphate oxidase superfamily)
VKINTTSQWDTFKIKHYLKENTYPIRLSFLNKRGDPQICSLWYQYLDGEILCASHKNSFLVNQLKSNKVVSFEVSTNDYPYKGVRGKGSVELVSGDADEILDALIERYLGSSNASLSTWLKSRAKDEFLIKITPTLVTSWDFSNRMEISSSV